MPGHVLVGERRVHFGVSQRALGEAGNLDRHIRSRRHGSPAPERPVELFGSKRRGLNDLIETIKVEELQHLETANAHIEQEN